MIEVTDLTQTYRSGKGVFDLTFAVEKGEVFGYLGPNGAGKTTTIRNLLGFANRDKGTARIKGLDCRKDAAEIQRFVGYLPGEISFLDNMTGTQFLGFLNDMRGIKTNGRQTRLLEQFDLDPSGAIRRMSKGMKQKLAIVAAFMHDPAVYILDEPTSGLDPFMQNVFLDLLDEERNRGKTILMSSHIFEEVQRSCNRAGIIRDGRIVAIEEIQSLNTIKQKVYIVTVEGPDDLKRLEESQLSVTRISDHRARITVGQEYHELFATLAECRVVGLYSEEQSLEEVFMQYYRTGERADV